MRAVDSWAQLTSRKIATKTSSFTLVAEPVTIGHRAHSLAPFAWTRAPFGGPCDRVPIHFGAPREQSLLETAPHHE